MGIKLYRTGWHKYDYAKSIPENLRLVGIELKKIGELNAKYNIIGDYQNHSGTNVGSAVWDIHELLEIDAPISLHFEYPLGGANHRDTEITIPREKVIEAMTSDLN